MGHVLSAEARGRAGGARKRSLSAPGYVNASGAWSSCSHTWRSGEVGPWQSRASAPIPWPTAVMGHCNNQHTLNFGDIDNAERKAPKDYPTSTQKVLTAVFWEGGNTCHCSLDCRDEILTEARSRSLVMARRCEKFLAGGCKEQGPVHRRRRRASERTSVSGVV
jgi:hypothetical protein